MDLRLLTARAEHDGAVLRAEDGLLPLPHAGDPRVTVFEDRQGRWMVEEGGVARPAVDGERVEAGSIRVLEVPPETDCAAVTTTIRLNSVAKLGGDVVLRFEVSRDREHVALSLVHAGGVLPLGGRAHHEVLLELRAGEGLRRGRRAARRRAGVALRGRPARAAWDSTSSTST